MIIKRTGENHAILCVRGISKMVIAPARPGPISIESPLPSPGMISDQEIKELEKAFPRYVLNAVEATGHQMSEIFRLILHVSAEQLSEEFGRSWEPYTRLYMALAHLLSAGTDIGGITNISAVFANKFTSMVESRGLEIIGAEAANDTLVSLFTVGRINRRLLGLVQTGTDLGEPGDMVAWSVAHSLASSCVLAYLMDQDGEVENAQVLARWSRYYAAGLYRLACSIGIVKVPQGAGDEPEASEEDRLLSEADIHDFVVRMNAEDDSGP